MLSPQPHPHNYKARLYNPVWGRFLQPDPIGYAGGMNLYGYAGNDPANSRDPSGLDPTTCIYEGNGSWNCSLLRNTCPTFTKCFSLGGGMIMGAVPYIGEPEIPSWFLGGEGGFSPDIPAPVAPPIVPLGCDHGLEMMDKSRDGIQRSFEAWDIIQNAASGTGIDPAMIAAIGIRETNFENIPQIGGGGGHGVFQIDITENPAVRASLAYDLFWAARWVAQSLASNMAALAAKFPHFTGTHLLQAAAASLNLGMKNISGNPRTIDVGTRPLTRQNYGMSVLTVIQCYK